MTRPGESADDATVVIPAVSDPARVVETGAVEETAPAAPERTEAGSVVRSSAVMALGSIVSRATGLLRTAAIGAAIGGLAVADDYYLAITLPNMVFELLVGGVLSSVIVPTLVRARRRDSDGGDAYAQRLLTLAVVALGLATVLATASAPLFGAVLTTKEPDERLVTALGFLIMPAIFFYGMAALLGAILNTRGHFAAPMWTPILNNLVVITTAVAFIAIWAVQPTPESLTTAQTLVLGLGTTAGIVVQAAGLWPALRKVGFRWRWRFDWRPLGLRDLARIGAWMLLFVVVSQAGLLIVLKLAKLAGDRAGPGPAIFQFAFLVFMMAHGIVAVSIMTALMPRLSAAAADGRLGDLVAQLGSGIRLVAVVLVPTTAAYVTLGRPLAVTLFEWGEFKHPEAVATGTVIAFAGLGLVPYAIMQLQQFAFYAMQDTRTPALVNVPVVALRVGVDVVFFLVLPAASVAAALMGGSAISFVAGALLSFLYLRRRLGRLGMGRVAATLVRLSVAAALAAVPALVVGYGITQALGDGKLASFVHLVLGGVVLLVGYVVAALALRVGEIREVATLVRRRTGRTA